MLKVKTTLEKILNPDFFPTLKRVMSKWPEAKDIHAFVKAAEAISGEGKVYQKTLEAWTEANGYQLKGAHKTVSGEEITDYLLQEYGKFGSDSKLSMAGTSDEAKDAFLSEKLKADAILKRHKKEITELLEKEYELDIPRLIRVTDKHIRKEIITANDCFILLPILDLSGVSDLEVVEDDEEKE